MKDRVLGIFFLMCGVMFGIASLGYPLGVAADMGPGYFPFLVSSLLIVAGLTLILGL